MSRLLSFTISTVVLALILAWEAAPNQTAAIDPASAHQVASDPIRNVDAESSGTVSDTPWVAIALERPLFQESRRPPKTADSAAEANRTARLTGVLTGPFGSRAIFTSGSDNKPIVVGEGAKVSDFVVRSIGPGVAIVENETGIQTLRLPVAAKSPR